MLKQTAPRSLLLATLGLAALSACDSDDDDSELARPLADASAADTADAGTQGADASAEPDPFQGCERSKLEADFEPTPLSGPGLVNGALPPGEYLFSTTYLQLRQEPTGQARFGELMQPIMVDLMQNPGLLAISLGLSDECGVARTLSVWRDDVAMLGFVTGTAHGAAVRSVGEVSRGGSLVTHWLGNESEASWSTAAQRAGADEGPFY